MKDIETLHPGRGSWVRRPAFQQGQPTRSSWNCSRLCSISRATLSCASASVQVSGLPHGVRSISNAPSHSLLCDCTAATWPCSENIATPYHSRRGSTVTTAASRATSREAGWPRGNSQESAQTVDRPETAAQRQQQSALVIRRQPPTSGVQLQQQEPLQEIGNRVATANGAEPGAIEASNWLAENAPWVEQPAEPPADGAQFVSQVNWTPELASGAVFPERVKLRLKQEELQVLPIWIAVHQHHDDGVARLFESICPLTEALVKKMTCHMEPFSITTDLAFSKPDIKHGPWRNYFIGVVGGFAPDEDDNMWPNQVLHRSRAKHNMRNGTDLARFLADPTREDFDAHSNHLARMRKERGYHKAWSWHRLRSRWGDETLAAFGVQPHDFS